MFCKYFNIVPSKIKQHVRKTKFLQVLGITFSLLLARCIRKMKSERALMRWKTCEQMILARQSQMEKNGELPPTIYLEHPDSSRAQALTGWLAQFCRSEKISIVRKCLWSHIKSSQKYYWQVKWEDIGSYREIILTKILLAGKMRRYWSLDTADLLFFPIDLSCTVGYTSTYPTHHSIPFEKRLTLQQIRVGCRLIASLLHTKLQRATVQYCDN